MTEVFIDSLRGAVLISGLVVVMMMLIESFNVESEGRIFKGIRKSGFLQIVVSAALGSIPGCVGAFAAVSLYTHRLLSFGALVAMMIATAGDESFMMLAMFPGKAAILFLVLFILAVVTGLAVDFLGKGSEPLPTRLEDTYEIHDDDCHDHHDTHAVRRHPGWKRVVMLLGVAVFVTALVTGKLEEPGHDAGSIDVSGESGLFWVFAVFSLVLLTALFTASDHFVDNHLWDHIVRRHLPGIFLWTFGVLFAVGLLSEYVDIDSWISDNTALMIILAAVVGLIPESGPHLIFVTLFASGVIPFPVLLANSIVQDGHASLPLLADSRISFVKAKAVKLALAAVVFVVWGLLL